MTRLGFVFVFLLLLAGYSRAQDSAGVRVISQPKAASTPSAESKNSGKVEGVVILKVEFRADATIGKVVDITKKDRNKLFNAGLTKQAIEAAKRITFEPARKNGRPITVTKKVEYSFTVY
jgi:hypothetical protein